MTTTHQTLSDLVKKYDRPGPRYTSYPTAPQWNDDFSPKEYRAALERGSREGNERFALYVHIPFCDERCHYCGCNVVISKKPEIVEDYLDHIEVELDHVVEVVGEQRRLIQLHWGGGTPTYLTPDQIQRLHGLIAQRFQIEANTETAIEVDPRVTSRDHIDALRKLGFNRISMGVQDLDPGVQEAIGRNQTVEQTRSLFDHCRECGFTGINFDLIYGLPKQTVEGWERTIRTVIETAPDRLAVYSYAHLPERLKHQAKMDESSLPDPQTKSTLISIARTMFLDAGYRPIGMDHFARPDDELATALDERRLHRNFMGYTTIADTQMLGIGPSAISFVGDAYAQNEKRLAKYYRMLADQTFATTTGMALTTDDRIRRWTIEELMCNFRVNHDEFAERFKTDFKDYFSSELNQLADMEADELLKRTDHQLEVTELGQLFVRNIAMTFDAYLKRPNPQIQYSRTV